MKDSSQLTAIAGPWFLAFNARLSVRPAMNVQDLQAGTAGMNQAAQKFGKAVKA
jgi:hypothetical protein